MAARVDAGGGMSNARRRRERRLRSWWRHEAQSVAAALTAARHHSAGPREEVVTRREERQEGEVHVEYDGLRAQTTPLPGTRPAPLPVVAGSQGVWPGAPRQPGSGVPSVVPPALAAPAEEAVDAATLSFLLAQTLAAQQQEEEELKEQAAVAELEADVVAQEAQLWQELENFRADRNRPPFHTLSPLLQAAVRWHAARLTVSRRKEKRKRRRKRKKRTRRSCPPWS